MKKKISLFMLHLCRNEWQASGHSFTLIEFAIIFENQKEKD